MLFSFVTPELILAVALFLLFVHVVPVRSGSGPRAQLIGLIVLSLAYPVVIVRARLLSLGPSYEEAAQDLGASPGQTLRRVTLPLLGPSIFASAAIVFALALDDFVIVEPALPRRHDADGVDGDLRRRPDGADAGRQRDRHADARHLDDRHRGRGGRLPADGAAPGAIGARPVG